MKHYVLEPLKELEDEDKPSKLRVWHIVDVVKKNGIKEITYCMMSFKPDQLQRTRPDEKTICHGCLWREEQSAKKLQEGLYDELK